MNKSKYIKRSKRIRNKLKKSNTDRFRLTVFRSSKNLSAQIIDDKQSKTLVSATSVEKKSDKRKKSDLSAYVADLIAKKALEKKITKVYFDRGGYKYHGRIKSFAEALRKKGLTF
jgi:large subunit ribosomal protein L18